MPASLSSTQAQITAMSKESVQNSFSSPGHNPFASYIYGMVDAQLLLAVVVGIAILLFLILRLKIQAFLALLISSIAVGLVAGMPGEAILDSVRTGMAETLGFVATIVGLGALFGAVLEHTGGAQAIAQYLLRKFGIDRAPLAMSITGFIVSIPVFFDVAFIILVPLIYALQKSSGRSLLRFGIPLAAGLAVTHTFIPPTPGPVAVADIIGANLGWMIVVGLIAGVPATLIAGLWWGKRISGRLHIGIPDYIEMRDEQDGNLPSAAGVMALIALPIVLILINTIVNSAAGTALPAGVRSAVAFAGHPFTALILANVIVWYVLGIRRGATREVLSEISLKSLAPAGIIILITGAGGVFKQVLIDTGVGTMMAEAMGGFTSLPVIFGFVVSLLIRVLQGSTTVAMITGAGMTAPILSGDMGPFDLAVTAVAIGSGAIMVSHVNDSGFWLVNRYFGMTEKETFRSWTVMTSLIGLVGFVVVLLLSLL